MDKLTYTVELVYNKGLDESLWEFETNDFNFLDCGFLAVEGNDGHSGLTKFINLSNVDTVNIIENEGNK